MRKIKFFSNDNLKATGQKRFFSLTKQSSIKTKLILAFSSIILVTGCISLATYFTSTAAVNEFNDMIDITVQTNNIIQEATKITKGSESARSYYDLYMAGAAIDNESSESKNQKKMILDGVAQIENCLIFIEGKNIDDNTVQRHILMVKNALRTFKEKLDEGFSAYEERDLESETVIRSKVIYSADTLITKTQELISAILSYEQQEKELLVKRQETSGLINIILIVITGALSIVFAYLLTSKIAGIILNLVKMSESVAKGDLRVKDIEVRTRDELYKLAQSFKIMTENLRGILQKISASSNNIAQSSELLKTNTEQSAAAIEQISISIQSVSKGALEQSEQSELAVSAIDNLYEGGKKILDNANKVYRTSEKANMAAVSGQEKMDQMLEQIKVIENKISKTQSVSEVLKGKTREIKRILDSISGIASQTNLLALNAAIEASRAGEYGRGFSVVADEVRKLAEESTKATKEITSVLSDIQKGSEQVADSMSLGMDEVVEGIKIAESSRETFEEIVSTSEDVNRQIKDTQFETEKIFNGIESLEGMSKKISDIAYKVKDECVEVAASIQEQMAGNEEIASSASIMLQMSEELQKIFHQFNMDSI